MSRKFLISAIPFSLIILTLTLYWFNPKLNLVNQAEGAPGFGQSPGTSIPLSGYAWSFGAGWISMGDTAGAFPYGVYLQPSVATYRSLGGPSSGSSGFAWSSNVGWIKFNPDIASLLATGESMPPPEPPSSAYPANDNWGARLELSGGVGGGGGSGEIGGSGGSGGDGANAGRITGWARACAVFASGCSGNLLSPPSFSLGGWDGWIKFTGDGYSAEVDNPTNPTRFTDDSYAWGNAILSKIRFCDNTPGRAYCVRFGGSTGGFTASCSVDPNNRIYPLNSGPYDFVWRTVTSGGDPNLDYSYVWSGDISHSSGPVSTPEYDYTNSISCGNTPSATSLTGNMAVTNGSLTASCTATLNVSCADPVPVIPTLATDSTVIKISSQPTASPAISSPTKFSHSSANGTIDISLTGINSVLNSSFSLLDVVQCRLNHDPYDPNSPASGFVSCDRLPSIQLTADPGEEDAYFNIKVNNPVPTGLNQNSPYRVLFDVEACSSPSGSGGVTCETTTKSIHFEYNVGTPIPT